MTAYIGLKNWQGIAQSNFTWTGELYLPENTTVPWKVWLGERFAMTASWPVSIINGEPGYGNYVNIFINVKIFNQFGTMVWQSGQWPGWIINGRTYLFDLVSHSLEEQSVLAAHMDSKILWHDNLSENIPVLTPITFNSTGQTLVIAVNDSAVAIMMGYNMTVKRPDGSTAQTISDQSMYVDPGWFFAFGFYSPFTFNMPGDWTVSMTLYVWANNAWQEVDHFEGKLCTVQGDGGGNPEFSNLAVVYSKL